MNRKCSSYFVGVLVIGISLLGASCGEEECTGTATECSEMPLTECYSQEICSLVNECTGGFGCTGLDSWDCNNEIGCNMIAYCRGTATQCEDLDEEICGEQSGCSFD